MFRDRIALMSSKAACGVLNFAPDTDINWLIRNLDSETAATLEFYNSGTSLSIEIERQYTGIHLKSQILHCSPTIYYRLKNIDSAAQYLAGDGFVSRESGVGDTLVQNIESVDSGSNLIIRPSPGYEWSIHSVMSNGAFELYRTDGSNPILSAKVFQPGSALTGLHLACTNSLWWEIKQLNSESANVGFDGIQTLAP